ncbi:NAD-glutamate dehydrogenase [Exilibacterium tricleocarpae]|uniref:NAD-glutamate dehydrogenase n=1 Tax=Exilibacterium tricleocarpae TaxID=2591008 RepID=A0A545TUV4_9GAMM|nr:NAD-glutamate dehydrogenase [Exilibacterium tricleocarpae]TQV80992.1 NAD-glutamate dehydrogenase [Exilibacterium tricleocarpae]
MDISVVVTDSKEIFFEQLRGYIDEKLHGAERDSVVDFADQYFEQYPLEELEGLQVSDVYGSIYSWWNYLQEHNLGSPKVRVFNPSLEEDGWLCPHTVVVVLQRDMPFLVDSIRMEINRRNIAIHAVKSTIVNLARNAQHRLVELAGRDGSDKQPRSSKNKTFQKEALVCLEINLHTSESDMQELARSIDSVLTDVTAVVDDYQPLLDRAETVEKNLGLAPKKVLPEQIQESQEFIRWLMSHFTFMGYSEYEFEGAGEDKHLRELPDKRLGLFKLYGRAAASVQIDNFNPGMARFHLTPKLLTFSKSSMRSRVHRRAYSDYVVIKRYSETGEVIGESRFLGLYTSPVYTLSPTKIPVIRQKIAQVIDASGIDPSSHDGKVLKQVLETFPRDELFQSSTGELFETAIGVARINERHMVRLFMRKDLYGKFVNCIIYIPREEFNTQIRLKIQQLIGEALQTDEHEFTTYFSESSLARTHIVFRIDPDKKIDYDIRRLEQKIVDITRSWADHLRASLVESYGEERGTRLFYEYRDAFPTAYRETYEARAGVHDIESFAPLRTEDEVAMSFYQPVGVDKNAMRFKVFRLNRGLELSDVIPVLEHLGLRVIGEHPFKIQKSDGGSVWLHDFDLVFGLPITIDVHAARNHFQEAFAAIWRGQTESDAFNRLVLGARLSWREVGLLRAYAAYMKQTAFNFSQGYIANTLANHLEITRNLVALFKASFEPRVNQGKEKDLQRIERLKNKIIDSLEKVDNLNEDRIIRRYLDIISGTLRTNFFQPGADGEPKRYISFKFSPRNIPDIPEPRPMFEIFVYSPRVEGVHLRGGKVARGGLRWSDRLEDYRTEVLGLVKAQQVKNAVIVPNGAKGGFVCKRPPQAGGREALLAEGIACYKIFIQGLLDITDNFIDGEVVPPKQVIRRDEDDPYLVVAADKGTATFSDIANEISAQYNHWLGDAFASGGSQGYDHKGMGITAKGAWVSVQRHFKEKGVDIQTEDFTVIGVGDMGGDVFGNGMLLSEHICLVAAFNHLHIFVDPSPDSAASFRERKRLFETPGSSWEDYDKALIAKGGGVFSRAAKAIIITEEMQARFDIAEASLTPNELLHRLLKAPVDLIWNGGIGTYVKASFETDADVGDKANDALRVDGRDLRCRVFGEGGNLGMSQLGRIEYALNGGACNTDFIDNAAGVDCSDHEVNIKILLNDIVTAGDMTQKQRNKLLADMTDTVSELVLTNNYRQTQAISLAQYQAPARIGEYRRLINALEAEGRLNRVLEFIPDDDTLLERQTQGNYLTRPELSVLISYAKVALKEELTGSDVPEDPYMAKAVEHPFPPVLRKKYRKQIYGHHLRREIVATQVANDMVNNMGITFCHRLMESTGASVGQVAKAYVTARDIYKLDAYWRQVEALDYKVPAQLQLQLIGNIMRRVRRGTRWFLRNRRSHLAPVDEVEAFAGAIQQVIDALPDILRGAPREEWQKECDRLIESGVPEALVTNIAIPPNLHSGLGMVEAARVSGADPVRVAEIYFVLGDRLGLYWFANQISEVKVGSYWQAMAREAYMDDLESQMRTLAISLIRLAGEDRSIDESVDRWLIRHHVLADRWKAMINELQGASGSDFAMFSVALRELLDLAQASQHCESLEDDGPLCILGSEQQG